MKRLNMNRLIALLGVMLIADLAHADGPGAWQQNNNIAILPQGNATTELKLEIADNRSIFRIGDKINFCYSSSNDGFISLWDYATDGTVKRLYPYPGSAQTSKYVQGGVRECVPTNSHVYSVSGPTGREDVVLMYTSEPNQPDQPSFNSSRSFSQTLEKTIDVAKITNISFEIVDANASISSSASNVNPNDVAVTNYNDFQNVYILSFGSNVYPLVRTNDDADLFAKTVKASFNVPDHNVKVYHNAKRVDFEEGFRWLRNVAQPNDLVLISYSGHGVTVPDTNGDEPYDQAITPYDLEITQRTWDTSLYIIDDELSEWLKSINSETVIMFTDACLSEGLYKSGIFGTNIGGRNKFFRAGVDAFAARKGFSQRTVDINAVNSPTANTLIDVHAANRKAKYAMMTATKITDNALELPTGGLFTLAFAENLEKAQRSRNVRNWSDMFQVITEDVRRISGGKQTPVLIDPDNVLSRLKFIN